MKLLFVRLDDIYNNMQLYRCPESKRIGITAGVPRQGECDGQTDKYRALDQGESSAQYSVRMHVVITHMYPATLVAVSPLIQTEWLIENLAKW